MLYFFLNMQDLLDKETETIGKRLARYRKAAGFTQKDLSEKLNISRSTLAEYERGRLRLHDALIIGIAKILNVNSDKLLGLRISKSNEDNISLRFLKRLKRIDNFSEVRKKAILRLLDDLILAEENKH
jgi:transcriptional regulator with XRE-family HTH domain